MEGETVLDVRALPKPGPFVAIMRHIVGMSHEPSAFVVRLLRDPSFLYPELVDLGWTWEDLDAPPGEVRLRLLPPQSRDKMG